MASPDPASLENLGFMLQDVARLMRREYNRRVEDMDLTQAQWRALAILSRNPGMWQCHLADVLEMQPISVARLLDRMQAAGWIERRADKGDRRAMQVYLTKQAEPTLKRLKKHGADCRAGVLKGISTAEQEQFMGVLLRMRANMTQEEAEKCMAEGE